MAILNYFDAEMITNVKISSLGTMLGTGADGQPIYSTPIVKYDDDAAVWQLSASDVLANDKINCPSSHSVVLDPEKVNGILIDSDTCEITLNGVLTQFKMYTPNNIMGLDEVMQFTALRKVTS